MILTDRGRQPTEDNGWEVNKKAGSGGRKKDEKIS
jgi:hypothetical protein